MSNSIKCKCGRHVGSEIITYWIKRENRIYDKMSDIESLMVAKTPTTVVISNGETDTNESSRVIKPSSHRQGPLCKDPSNRAKAIIVVALNFTSKWIMTFHRKKEKIERKKGGGYRNKYFFLSCRGLSNEFGGKEWVLGNFICICF